MRLISRYILSQLLAPFTYALGALTGIMILDQVAKKFGQLVGKGLDWRVIGEVFVLSLPFIIAMTLPMAVLVAVLFAFSHLAADNEITAMRGCGLSVGQMLGPVLAAGVAMAAVNFIFVDQVLPRSNAILRNLWIDIGRKKPTFQLREQVINELPPSSYFLRAGRIDAGTGRMKDITIYDMGSQTNRRVVYADSGRMAFTASQRDVSLLLFNGTIHQYKLDEPQLFQLTEFVTNDIRVKNVANELERNTSGDVMRGDREMSSCEMRAVTHEADRDYRSGLLYRDFLLERDLRFLSGLPLPKTPPEADLRPVGDYCRLYELVPGLVLPKKAAAQDRPAPVRPPPGPPGGAAVPPRSPIPGFRPAPSLRGAVDEPPPPPVVVSPPAPALSNFAEINSATESMRAADLRGDSYAVEIHKKWSISAACISFVLVGIALALRFPRGGMGLVVGGSLSIFCLYYVALTAGESLADRGIVGPATAMWAPNVVLMALGIWGLIVVNREGGSTRGGDLSELADLFRSFGGRLRRRSEA